MTGGKTTNEFKGVLRGCSLKKRTKTAAVERRLQKKPPTVSEEARKKNLRVEGGSIKSWVTLTREKVNSHVEEGADFFKRAPAREPFRLRA